MLQFAIVCCIVAVISALFGFGVIASAFMGVAKIVFFVFIVLAVLSLLGGAFRRTPA